jgi:hypothetical protein
MLAQRPDKGVILALLDDADIMTAQRQTMREGARR